MSNVRSLACPSCGASLTVDGNSAEVKCSYCGNTVIVPPELRTPAPGQPQVVFQNDYQQISRSTNRLTGCIVGVVVLSIVGSLIITVIAVVVPLFAVNSIVSSVHDIVTSVPFAALSSTSSPLRRPTSETAATAVPSGYATLVKTIGSKGTGPGYFDDARGVAVDGDGNIYVSEYTSGRMQKFDAKGKFLTTWSTVGKNPLRGLAADRAGDVYVVRQGAILKYDSSGNLKDTFQGSDDFDDVAVLPDSGLVAFSYLNRDDLVRLNVQGDVVNRIKGAISSQTDNSELEIRVAVDGSDNIYALGTFSNAVFKFNKQGKYLSKFGEDGNDPGQFQAVDAIAVDNQSRVYVSSIQGIQIFSSEGRYLGVIKVPNYVAFGLAFDSNNALYVASRDFVYKYVIN